MIRSQQLDYAEHGIDAPPELERLAKRALVIGDEMTTGLPTESARASASNAVRRRAKVRFPPITRVSAFTASALGASTFASTLGAGAAGLGAGGGAVAGVKVGRSSGTGRSTGR